VVVDEATLHDWVDVLGELRPTWVAIRCPPEIAARREHARGDRPIGMTGTQTTSVHRSLSYAFDIDTGELTPREVLTRVCAGLGL
jgi:chloramphenicol 3-O phosphotransferase